MEAVLDFEKPILALEKKLQDLRELSKQEGVELATEITFLEKKVSALIEEIYSHLTPWQRVQLSRHPNRPYALDYIQVLFPDFMELHGDRCFSDDAALIGGTATWKTKEDSEPIPVMILANQKGRATKQKLERNFGMAKPEGYRKARRLMEVADRFGLPLITLIDTPGAYPGIDAEERGQSLAIAECLETMSGIRVPSIAVVIGEGGSGGALAIGVADRVFMQEYSTYSVISAESCAAILWSDPGYAEKASQCLKMTAEDLKTLKVIDGIIHEPIGGAHRDWDSACTLLNEGIRKPFGKLIRSWKKHPELLLPSRQEKLRSLGNKALAHAPQSNTELET